MLKIQYNSLRRQLDAVFGAWGMDESFRQVCIDRMTEADLMGIDSHGIGMLPIYEQNRLRGGIVVDPEVTVVKDLGAIALLDGGHGMGHIAATQAMELAMDKARQFGIGAVNVRHSNHFGAAGAYSNLARRAGLIGLCTTGTTQRSVVPTFGREPRFSTNPIAFAAPGRESDGFSLDMATSTVAVGKLRVAQRAGKSMPVGWVVDENGQPETDPTRALAATPKRLTPLGGTRDLGSHKGYGLAMMVEILSSVLGGSNVGGYDIATGERGQFINVGHFFLAIDPEAFADSPGGFESYLDRLVDYLHATDPADPSQPVLVAGDPERESMRERRENGIPMTAALYEEVREVCQSCGAKFLLS